MRSDSAPAWRPTLRAALVTGAAASLLTAAATALAARREGRGAWQPLNATSHWLNGDGAAQRTRWDLRHTGVGLLTNHAACVFWAACFEAWRGWRGPAGAAQVVGEAAAMAVVAAAVDYGPTPQRFTPGWELVLSRGGMAIAYAGLTLGLAAGALLTADRASPAARRAGGRG